MHIIQKKIIEYLIYNEFGRFRDLRPDRVESNLFVYHLKQLLRDGYIEKVDQRYTLTPQGLVHVNRLSHQSMKTRDQAIILSIIDITNQLGETLIMRRDHQPYLNMLGFPSGKVHRGESVAMAAQREVTEKTGVSLDSELVHRGDVYVSIYSEDTLISQVLGHVSSATSSDTDLADAGSDCFWAMHDSLDVQTVIPGLHDIKKLLKSEQFFFAELIYKLPV